MMSRRRVVASITCAAIAGSACVASSGASSSSWFNQDQAAASAPSSGIESSPTITRAGGSANQDGGPRVSIYAEVETSSGANLVRANFHLDDDAYVLVGHIDADGVLRITFPEVTGGQRIRPRPRVVSDRAIPRWIRQPVSLARFATGMDRPNVNTAMDSYDGGLGWVFVIASWQPMHFEKFSTGGYWDSFELNDADYMKDPRPAVYELAALLAGTNSSSYTVRFANVHDTQTFYGGSRSALRIQQFRRRDVQRVRLWLLVRFCVDAVWIQRVQSGQHVRIRPVVLVARKPVPLQRGGRLLLSQWDVPAIRVSSVRIRRHRAGSARRESGYRPLDRRRSDSPSPAHAAARTDAPRAGGRDGRRRRERIEDGAGTR